MAGVPTPPGASPHAFGVAGLLGWPVAHSRSPVIRSDGRGLLPDEGRPAFRAWFGAMPSMGPEPVRAIEAPF